MGKSTVAGDVSRRRRARVRRRCRSARPAGRRAAHCCPRSKRRFRARPARRRRSRRAGPGGVRRYRRAAPARADRPPRGARGARRLHPSPPAHRIVVDDVPLLFETHRRGPRRRDRRGFRTRLDAAPPRARPAGDDAREIRRDPRAPGPRRDQAPPRRLRHPDRRHAATGRAATSAICSLASGPAESDIAAACARSSSTPKPPA